MRIDNDFMRIMGQYNKNNKVERVNSAKGVEGKKDVMMLSPQARELQLTQKAMSSIPDVREDKVRLIEEQLNSGNYNVSGQEIADKLLRNSIDKKA